jgi:hypothetical protein
MRRGFKTEAKKLALGVRAELGLGASARFDPYALAHEYGIPVYSLSELAQHEDMRHAGAHYALDRPSTFSAALVPLGNGRFILDNDYHAPVRRRNSVSHEMSHVLLEHAFTSILLTCDGCRSIDRDKEGEADWLAGELLIPYAAAERAARLDLTDEQVAQMFDVSTQLAAMRMNYSGARIIVARKRRYASQLRA